MIIFGEIMKVKCLHLECVSNVSAGPSPEKFTLKESYDDILQIGEIYTVYAQSIWTGVINYLIDSPINGKANPEWVRAELFEIVDASVPNNTFFQYYGLDDKRGVQALWGYKELIFDDSHYNKLIEVDNDAITVFLKRKQEIDKNS
jgi:hypothetical protein